MFEQDYDETKPLTREEFIMGTYQQAILGEEVDEHTWAVGLASMLGVVSLNHEELSKEAIVRGLQQMAIKIPESLLAESTAQLMSLRQEMGLDG